MRGGGNSAFGGWCAMSEDWRQWAFAHVRSAQNDWVYRHVRACDTEQEAVAFLKHQYNLSGSGGPRRLTCNGTTAGIEVFADEPDERRCPHSYHRGGYLGTVTYQEIARRWRNDGVPVQMTLFDAM